LPSLRRCRRAFKVLARLKPLIEAAQGGLAAETLAPQYDSLLAGANIAPAVPGQVVHLADSEVQVYRSRIHQILFCALLGAAVVDTLNIFLPNLPVIVLNTLLSALVAIAVLVALVKQHQTDLKPAVRVLTWCAAVYVGLGYLAGYVIMMAVIPAHGFDGTQWGYLKGLSELKPFETAWWLGVLVTSAAFSGIFGLLGLRMLREHWREKQPAA
jgi:hypothetical protein